MVSKSDSTGNVKRPRRSRKLPSDIAADVAEAFQQAAEVPFDAVERAGLWHVEGLKRAARPSQDLTTAVQQWQASAGAAESSLASLGARLTAQAGSPLMTSIRELGERYANNDRLISESPVVKAARERSERHGGLLNSVTPETPLMKSMRELSEAHLKAPDYAARLGSLAQPLAVESLPPPVVLRDFVSREARAAEATEEQTIRLVEVSSRTSEQIAQLAQIAEAGVTQVTEVAGVAAAMSVESVRLRETMTDAAQKAGRSGNIMIALTVALVMLTIALGVLTYVLVAAELGLWPFVAQ
jgi:hypothetical protein